MNWGIQEKDGFSLSLRHFSKSGAGGSSHVLGRVTEAGGAERVEGRRQEALSMASGRQGKS